MMAKVFMKETSCFFKSYHTESSKEAVQLIFSRMGAENTKILADESLWPKSCSSSSFSKIATQHL